MRHAGVLARAGANAAPTVQETPGKRSMTQFSFRFPRAYRLKPVGQREEAALSLVGIGASNKSVLVPYSPNLEYVVASRGVGALPIESSDFRVETLGALPTLWARLRLAFFFKERKFLKFDEFYLFSAGSIASTHSTSGPNLACRARSSVRCTPRPPGVGIG